MKNRINEKIEEITVNTLIVGVDIAKEAHWARFVDYRGLEIGKPVSFKSDRAGFEHIVSQIEKICKNHSTTTSSGGMRKAPIRGIIQATPKGVVSQA